MAEEELQAFAKERRAAMLLQAGGTVVGVFLLVTAVVFYLVVSVIFIIEPFRRTYPRVTRHIGGMKQQTRGNGRCGPVT